jgi:hypothetical protein
MGIRLRSVENLRDFSETSVLSRFFRISILHVRAKPKGTKVSCSFGELILGKITTRGITGGLPNPKTPRPLPSVLVRLGLGPRRLLRAEPSSRNRIAPLGPSLQRHDPSPLGEQVPAGQLHCLSTRRRGADRPGLLSGFMP